MAHSWRQVAPSPWNVKPTKKLRYSLKSVGELVFSASKQGAQSADYQTDHQNDDDHQEERNGSRDVGMHGGKPGQAYGDHVFSQTDADIGNWFW